MAKVLIVTLFLFSFFSTNCGNVSSGENLRPNPNPLQKNRYSEHEIHKKNKEEWHRKVKTAKPEPEKESVKKEDNDSKPAKKAVQFPKDRRNWWQSLKNKKEKNKKK